MRQDLYRTKLALLTLAVSITACTGLKQGARDGTVDHQRLLSQQQVDAVLYQHTSAEVYRLYQQGYELARIRLDANLAKGFGHPPAVVVDVDETVLDNSPYEMERIATGTTYSDSTWKAWTQRAAAKALPGALAFLEYAGSRQCEVYYVTNRSEEEKLATILNLKLAGMPFADAAHVLCMEGTSDKSVRRRGITISNDIMLYLGDQLRDFSEDFKDRSIDFGKPLVDQHADTLRDYFVLFPNSMYGTWRDVITGKGTDAQKHDAVQRLFAKYAQP